MFNVLIFLLIILIIKGICCDLQRACTFFYVCLTITGAEFSEESYDQTVNYDAFKMPQELI